jgi:hypothetical protein
MPFVARPVDCDSLIAEVRWTVARKGLPRARVKSLPRALKPVP